MTGPVTLAPLPPIEIRTARLRIAPFTEDHLTERYASWLNDPDVVLHSGQQFRTHTLESCREYMAEVAAAGHQFLALICHNDELGHIGNMTVKPERAQPFAWMNILIGEKGAWGKGYGTEAWRAVSDHLLASDRIEKVYAGTLTTNTGMLEIMRRTGMRKTERIENFMTINGQPVEAICAVLDKPVDAFAASNEKED